MDSLGPAVKRAIDLSENDWSQSALRRCWSTPMSNPDTTTSDAEYHIDAPAPLRFERRSQDRWPVDGVVTAFRLAGDRFGEKQSLKMLDYSWDGLGANSSAPLEPGLILGSRPQRRESILMGYNCAIWITI